MHSTVKQMVELPADLKQPVKSYNGSKCNTAAAQYITKLQNVLLPKLRVSVCKWSGMFGNTWLAKAVFCTIQ